MNYIYEFISKMKQAHTSHPKNCTNIAKHYNELSQLITTIEQENIERLNSSLSHHHCQKKTTAAILKKLMGLKISTEKAWDNHNISKGTIEKEAFINLYLNMCAMLIYIRDAFEPFINVKFLPSRLFCQPQKNIINSFRKEDWAPSIKNSYNELFSKQPPLESLIHEVEKLVATCPYSHLLSVLLDSLASAIYSQAIQTTQHENTVVHSIQQAHNYFKQTEKSSFKTFVYASSCLIGTGLISLPAINNLLGQAHNYFEPCQINRHVNFIKHELPLVHQSLLYTNDKPHKKQQTALNYFYRKACQLLLPESLNSDDKYITCTLPPKEFVQNFASLIQKGHLKAKGSNSVKGVYDILLSFIQIKKEKGEGYITPASMHTYHKEIIEEELEQQRSKFISKRQMI